MSLKNDVNSNQFGFALEVLKLLAEKPLRKTQLENLLRDRDISCEDLPQKITRVIRKLKDCGLEIRSAPNRPYELIESSFPVILSEEQRQALAMAAHFLADMGFSAQASQIYRIGNINKASQPESVTVDFHPPVDYSENRLDDTVRQLQKRFQQKRRFVIWYRNSKGEERSWDLDKSELRLHNGTLYLFALVPDCRTYHIQAKPNIEQNFVFRIDRIVRVGAASNTPWIYSQFPTLNILYRLTGSLGNYKPRRSHESELQADNTDFVDILTQEDCLFWFRQRMLQYGASARVIDPLWLAQDIGNELKKAYASYSVSLHSQHTYTYSHRGAGVMPKKIREIKAMLKEAGFVARLGKGSHSNWKHPLLPLVITVARKDGDDAPRYLEQKVEAALAKLKEMEDGQS